MERCDFSSVMTIVRRFISDDYDTNQTALLEDVFSSLFTQTKETITFDMALVCRWFTGQAKISPKITQFYSRDGNREKLAADLENNVLLSMYDSSMAAQEVYRLLMQDDTISERVKKECSRHYPCDSREDEASFIADVLCFGMEREFIKRDPKVKNLLADGKLSPILSDFIADEGAPKPCRHFCGREKELEMLHELLLEHGKVFLHGIAGIGKSELAKAYAKQHRKEYTNVLYLSYTGNLMQDIADMDFADDLPDDSEQERFRKHNRFLRTLKEDTLFIVDNFNTTASQDSTLSVVMKYRCRMLFTTRSRFDNYDSMEVTEDGQSRKATYYDHIHTLFSLYQLAGDEQDIMRSMAFVPTTGISSRVFAGWLMLRNMNTINDLVEKGFIQTKSCHSIALHPMIQEVAITETKPSVRNCHTLLNSLQELCLRHGEEVSYYKQLFQTVNNIVTSIEKDDTASYLRFLEDSFPYMQKYGYESGMELILTELASMLKDNTIGSVSDRALLLDFRAANEKKPEKAIKLEKEAVMLISEVTAENALLAANLHANLGGLYKQTSKLELAKQHMETGIHLLEQYGLAPYHDSIPQITNYAVLLTDMGEPYLGLSALQRLSRVIKESNSDVSGDYAVVQEAMGNICLSIGDVLQATTHFKNALAIYEVLFDAEPELIEEKKQDILETYTQAGVQLGRQWLDAKN